MNTADIEEILLRHAKLRIENEMASYIHQHLVANPNKSIPVIGGDARTGQPTRLLVSPALLQQASTPSV